MDLLTSKIKPMYFRYLTAALIGATALAVVTWLAVIFFDGELLRLFGAEL